MFYTWDFFFKSFFSSIKFFQIIFHLFIFIHRARGCCHAVYQCSHIFIFFFIQFFFFILHHGMHDSIFMLTRRTCSFSSSYTYKFIANQWNFRARNLNVEYLTRHRATYLPASNLLQPVGVPPWLFQSFFFKILLSFFYSVYTIIYLFIGVVCCIVQKWMRRVSSCCHAV